MSQNKQGDINDIRNVSVGTVHSIVEQENYSFIIISLFHHIRASVLIWQYPQMHICTASGGVLQNSYLKKILI